MNVTLSSNAIVVAFPQNIPQITYPIVQYADQAWKHLTQQPGAIVGVALRLDDMHVIVVTRREDSIVFHGYRGKHSLFLDATDYDRFAAHLHTFLDNNRNALLNAR